MCKTTYLSFLYIASLNLREANLKISWHDKMLIKCLILLFLEMPQVMIFILDGNYNQFISQCFDGVNKQPHNTKYCGSY